MFYTNRCLEQAETVGKPTPDSDLGVLIEPPEYDEVLESSNSFFPSEESGFYVVEEKSYRIDKSVSKAENAPLSVF